ncbi:MAG TPA: hypothetical protein VMS08_02960 [Candidatus Saccharimonadia bacterium]|nr:hypothetical protein [Candidatus Saccharimonadia bacterium]
MTTLLHSMHFASSACGTSTGFLPSIYDGMTCTASGNITITSVKDVLTIVGNILRILIAASGGLAVIIIIVAAIYYITSTGEPARIKRAKDIIINVTIGLILIVIAYAVVDFIAKGF